MAEGLGTGLQNLLQRFDSASHLKKVLYNMLVGHFSFFYAGIYARNPLSIAHLHKELNYHKDNQLRQS